MYTQNIIYDTPGDFSFLAASIDVIVSAKLKLQSTANSFNQDFSSDIDFTYDPAKAEFTGGQVQKKDLTALNSVIGANYTSSFDLNWAKSGGSLTATIVGAPVLSGGVLRCSGGGNNAVRYTNAEVGSAAGIGWFYTEYIPQYSGTPAANSNVFEIFGGSNANKKVLMHSMVDGRFRVTIHDSAAVNVHLAVSVGGVWIPVSGTIYRIFCLWNNTTGQFSIYINGALWGSTPATAWSSSATATNFQVGAGINYSTCNAYFDNTMLGAGVPAIAAYTVPDTIYANSNVILPEMEYTGDGTLLTATALSAISSGSPRLTIQIGRSGNYLWHNGVNWAVSTSDLESNTVAQFNAAIASLPVNGERYGQFKLHLDASNTQQSMSDLTLDITGEMYSTSSPDIINNSGVRADEFFGISASMNLNGESITFVLEIDGVDYWYNTGTSAWETSSGVAESNTEAEINLAPEDLDITRGVMLKLKAYLTSSTGEHTPELIAVTLSYSLYNVQTTVEFCEIWGYLQDNELPVAGATITVTAKLPVQEDGNIVSVSKVYTSRSTGYFELVIVRNAVINYLIEYTNSLGQDVVIKGKNRQVPNSDRVAITALSEAA